MSADDKVYVTGVDEFVRTRMDILEREVLELAGIVRRTITEENDPLGFNTATRIIERIETMALTPAPEDQP